MKKKRSRARLILVLLSCSLSLVIAEAGQQHRTLIVTGHAGELSVVEMGGRWIGSFRDEARKSLRLVQVAATTESDQSAFQLLTNVFNTMNKLSDRFLEANRTRTYISPDALNNDPLNQGSLTCAHSLAAMAANGQFMDDGSCH